MIQLRMKEKRIKDDYIALKNQEDRLRKKEKEHENKLKDIDNREK